jgi:aspartate aminotransferase
MFNEGEELRARFGAENVYDFSLGNPDVDPPAEFSLAVKRILEAEIPGKHGYMNNAGYYEVREKVARRVTSEQGVVVSPEKVVMTVGAGGALNIVFHSLVDPGDNVIVCAPAYLAYRNYLSVHGGDLLVVPGRADFRLDLAAMEQMITERTAAVLVNSPNNPSGVIYATESMRSLAELLERRSRETGRRIYLISDEPYREIIYREEPVPAVFELYPHSIVCYSYSKALSIAGERIGWAAVHPEAEDSEKIVAGMVGAMINMGYTSAPALMQRVIGAIDGVTVDVDTYRRRRDILVAGLGAIGYEFVVPDGAYYLFPKAPGGDDLAFCDGLRRERILVVPGRGFEMPGYFRISYCVDEAKIAASIEGFDNAYRAFTRR